MSYPTLGAAVGTTLTYNLNRKAGTLINSVPSMEATGAANVWAGTTGLELVHALNVKAGNTFANFVGLQEVLNQLAGSPNLEVDLASAYL